MHFGLVIVHGLNLPVHQKGVRGRVMWEELLAYDNRGVETIVHMRGISIALDAILTPEQWPCSPAIPKSVSRNWLALLTIAIPRISSIVPTEVTGETSKSPNKTFLARRIIETLAKAAEPGHAEDATSAAQSADTPPQELGAGQEAQTDSSATSGDDAPQETPLTKLSVEELRAKYVEVIGRDTSSTNKAYLVWKLREAAKGKIPIGPRQRTSREPGSMKVLPLRMDAELVAKLDAARERLGLTSRMELLRRAIHSYLEQQGEVEVAALFAPAEA